jgi:hypothetical protein
MKISTIAFTAACAGALAGFAVNDARAAGSGTLADPITSGCDASGSFCILPGGPDADDVKMFLDNDKNTDTFFGSTTGNGSHFTDTIKINTMGFVDTSSGFATIKPIKDGLLTDALYTPQAPNLFDGFFTRGQLVYTDPNPCPAHGPCAAPAAPPAGATVLMQINGTGPIFSFFEGLPESNDFADIGIDEPGENETLAGLISSVHIWVATPNVSFFELKQASWSPCEGLDTACGLVINPTDGAAPEPSTWAMFIAGFSLMGALAYFRGKKASPASPIAGAA